MHSAFELSSPYKIPWPLFTNDFNNYYNLVLSICAESVFGGMHFICVLLYFHDRKRSPHVWYGVTGVHCWLV